MNSREFIEKVIFTPYKNMGRDFNGLDCYGIWWLAAVNVMGIQNPPKFSDRYQDSANTIEVARLIKSEQPSWLPVASPEQSRFGDIVLMSVFCSKKRLRLPSHCALSLGSDRFIEIDVGWSGPQTRYYRSELSKHRLVGIYRYAH